MGYCSAKKYYRSDLSQYPAIFFIILFIWLANFKLPAQIKDIGLPFINNYNRSIYQAGTQNWAITQDPQGILYFGNNDGVLTYDGHNWELHPMPNGSVVRSVAFINDRLYAGGFDEFGYFQQDHKGTMEYISLYALLPVNQRVSGEIWSIFSTHFGLVFQSFYKLYIFRNDELITINPPSEFGFSYYVNNELYLVDRETGLYTVNDDKLELLYEDSEFFRENEIPFIIPFTNNNLLIGTTNQGMFLFNGYDLISWQTPLSNIFLEQQIYTGIALPGSQIALGTIQDGLYIIDHKGRIILQINRKKGLQNNSILSMFTDREGNLWLGLDNGIDALEISSPVTLLNHLSTYTSIINGDILYIGTNSGLYARNLKKIDNQSLLNEEFKLIEGTKGQVWSLKIINNTLICGHANGTFRIDGYAAKRISDVQGGWDYVEVPWDQKKVIGGVYTGILLYEKASGPGFGINLISQIEEFNESSREMLFDNDNNLWITHGYKGIYRMQLSEDCKTVIQTELYNNSNGLPELPYSLSEIDGQFYVVAKNGIYKYDNNRNFFNIDSKLTTTLGNFSGLTKVVEDYRGDIWFFSTEGLSVLRRQEDGGFIKIAIPFNRIKGQLMSSTFENIFIYNNENVFIGGSEGLLHYNAQVVKDFKIQYKTFLRRISVKNNSRDSLLFHTFMPDSSQMEEGSETKLPYRFNSISFQFMSPYFEAPRQITYAYRLKGYNNNWSSYSHITNREYTNLREGSYTFEVQAKNVYDHASIPATFEFEVLPPLYRSKFAYAIYFISLVFLIFLLANYIRKKVEKAREYEKHKLNKVLEAREQEFIEETKMSQEEIERLKNEKLLIEMRHKDMELANSTMHIIQKNKFLNKIKNDAHELISQLQLESNRQKLKQIVKRIDKDIRSDQQWKVFDQYFEEVHQDFTKRIKEKHPALTPNDLRLCSYLRMNISTKEISPLMNISVRGVEISRYRLRKKLNLDREANLTEYIMSI
jgi:ligand-binding sensor domain-containing protein/DNA-binding CsgD family transcriptional regulator